MSDAKRLPTFLYAAMLDSLNAKIKSNEISIAKLAAYKGHVKRALKKVEPHINDGRKDITFYNAGTKAKKIFIDHVTIHNDYLIILNTLLVICSYVIESMPNRKNKINEIKENWIEVQTKLNNLIESIDPTLDYGMDEAIEYGDKIINFFK